MITKKKLICEIEELSNEVRRLRRKVDQSEIDGVRVVASIDHPEFPRDIFYRGGGRDRQGKVSLQELAEYYIIDGTPLRREKQTVIFPRDGGESKE